MDPADLIVKFIGEQSGLWPRHTQKTIASRAAPLPNLARVRHVLQDVVPSPRWKRSISLAAGDRIKTSAQSAAGKVIAATGQATGRTPG